MKTAKREMVTLHTCYMVGTTVRFTNRRSIDLTAHSHTTRHQRMHITTCKRAIIVDTSGWMYVWCRDCSPYKACFHSMQYACARDHGKRNRRVQRRGKALFEQTKHILQRQPMPIQQQSMVSWKAQGDTSLYHFF